MNSIPVEVEELGLCAGDYIGVAKNVRRVLNISADGRRKILDRANLDLSERVIDLSRSLAVAMANDREFFDEAGLEYWKGVPPGGCFAVALVDYLLRNQNRICSL